MGRMIKSTNEAASYLQSEAERLVKDATKGVDPMDPKARRKALYLATERASRLLSVATDLDFGTKAEVVWTDLQADSYRWEEFFRASPRAMAFFAKAYAAEQGVEPRSLFSASGWNGVKAFFG